MTRWLPALLLGLLALPFDPFWIDFERARRGLLMLIAAGLAVPALRQPLEPSGVPLLLLALWHGLRSAGAGNALDAADDSLHLLALWLAFQWASRHDPRDFARAAVAVGSAAALYTLALAAGLDWPLGYGTARDPAGPFGNRNFAAEALAVAGALAALALRDRSRPLLSAGALAAIAAALVVNGSRSGAAVAIGLGCVLLGQAPSWRHRLLPIVVALAGAGLGLLWPRAAAEPVLATAPADAAGPVAPSTLEVRAEIWRSSLRMIADRPMLGTGTGQFAREYPIYRSPREIELSTFGHRFRARPESAHNDWLEIAVETGLPGAALWAAFVVAAAMLALREGGVARLGPLAAFLATTLVRAPLGNAPAAFLAITHAGSGPLPPAASFRRLRTWLGALAALPLAVLGSALLAGQTCAARVVEDRLFATPGRDPIAACERALAFTPGDPRLHLLRLQLLRDRSERALEAEPARKAELSAEYGRSARSSVEALARLDPNGVLALLLRARFALDRGDLPSAQALLLYARELDARDPEVLLWLARIHAERGDTAAALQVLYHDPGPRLRDELPAIVGQLAAIARDRGDDGGARLYDLEANVLTAADLVRRQPGSPAANRAVQVLLRDLTGSGAADLRLFVVAAAQFLALEQTADAERLGRLAAERGLSMAAHDRRLFAELLERLRPLAAWRPLLD
jgi:O-antigen ligase